MADVFISYKREEIAHAQRVAEALQKEGFSAFYDLALEGIAVGDEWDLRLERELDRSKAVVSLWSPASVTSANVRDECRRANKRGILCPAFIEHCTPPLGLGVIQAADLSGWKGGKSNHQWRYLVDSGISPKVRAPGGVDGAKSDDPNQVAFLKSLAGGKQSPLTREDFERVAAYLQCDWEAIAAVAEVESGQLGGYDSTGWPRIVFERHLFSRKTHRRFDRSHPLISCNVAGGYPQQNPERWKQLAQAYTLNPGSALESTSWGLFQILGQNYRTGGYNDVHPYVRDMMQSPQGQLAAFVNFIAANNLTDEVRRRDWSGFASRYNGPGYASNRYDAKMAEAYARLRAA